MTSLLGTLVGVVLRVWLATLRLRLITASAVPARGALALAFWHGQQLALLRWARLVPMVALVSPSRDGEIAARALAVLGVESARGSSSRGGAAGLRAIVRRLRAGRHAAFAVDGPKGPARRVRDGRGDLGVALAARLGASSVVPMAAACSRCHVFARAWDRFELPYPFSRVVVVLGAPLGATVEPEALGAAIDEARRTAERALERGGGEGS